MRKKLIYLLFLVTLSRFLAQTTFQFQWLNPKPFANDIIDIITFSENEVLIFSDKAAIYKTTDGGINFDEILINTYNKSINAVDFVNSSLGFLGGDDDLLMKTLDGGLTWDTLDHPSISTIYDIEFYDADTGYAVGGTAGDVIKTVDGGTTWTQFNLGTSKSARQISIVSATDIFIGADSLFKSTDCGKTWQRISPTSWGGKTIRVVHFINENYGWVSQQYNGQYFYTKDGGTNWTARTFPYTAMVCGDIEFKDTSNGFAVATLGYIFRTTDGGDTWKTTPNSPFGGGNTIKSIESINGTYYIGGNDGRIAKTSDSTFTPLYTDSFPDKYRSTKIHFEDENNGYVFGGYYDGLIYKTTDGGSSWTQLADTLGDKLISYTFANSNVWYVGNDDNGIFKTIDGGVSFVPQTSAISGTTADVNDLGSAGTDTVFAASSGGAFLMKTVDGGTTWTEMAGNPFTDDAEDLHVFNGHSFIAVGQDGGAFKTVDGGASWDTLSFAQPTNTSLAYYSVNFYDDNYGFVGGNEDTSGSTFPVLYKTLDGGTNWQKITLPDIFLPPYEYIGGISFGCDSYIWASTNYGNVLFSADSGNTWEVTDRHISTNLSGISAIGEKCWLSVSSGSGICQYTATLTSVDELSGTPSEFRLEQNYPNPFNPSTTINFSVSNTSFVSLKVYDVLGRLVTTLVDGQKNMGNYSVNFNASNLSSGVYFYTLKVDNKTFTKKMMLLK